MGFSFAIIMICCGHFHLQLSLVCCDIFVGGNCEFFKTINFSKNMQIRFVFTPLGTFLNIKSANVNHPLENEILEKCYRNSSKNPTEMVSTDDNINSPCHNFIQINLSRSQDSWNKQTCRSVKLSVGGGREKCKTKQQNWINLVRIAGALHFTPLTLSLDWALCGINLGCGTFLICFEDTHFMWAFFILINLQKI